MTIHTGTCTEPQTKGCQSNQTGMVPDRNNHRFTLHETILMGGFIPIDEVIDLLPFRIRTLRKWARKGTFAPCFKRMHTGPCGNSILFINVSHFASRFEELAESALLEDSRKGFSPDPSMDEIGGLDEFAKLALSTQHI